MFSWLHSCLLIHRFVKHPTFFLGFLVSSCDVYSSQNISNLTELKMYSFFFYSMNVGSAY